MAVNLFWLAVAGTLGTWARFGLTGAVSHWTGGAFPWSTLAVNVIGSFLVGVFWILAEERAMIGAETRIIILVGFMGAFTTFSTFAFETGQMLRDEEWLKAGLNLLAQNAIGTAALLFGFVVGRQF